jgi:hypothetical protein
MPLTQALYRAIGLELRAMDPDPALGDDLRAHIASATTAYDQATMLDRRHREYLLLSAGWMAAYTGDTAAARNVLEHAGAKAASGVYPANVDMALAIRAELAMASGQPEDAVALLEARVRAIDDSYFTHAVLSRAYLAAGRDGQALEQANWLVAHRGLAYGEFNSLSVWQPVNVLESNLAYATAQRAATGLGDAVAAGKAQAALVAAWGDAANGPLVARRRRY